MAAEKTSPIVSVVWILLTFVLIYFFVAWFIPVRYTGVEDVGYGTVSNSINNKSSVLYYHPDCEHCDDMIPKYRRASKRFPTVRFFMVNAEKSAMPKREAIQEYPTIRIYNDDTVLKEMVGKNDEDALVEELDAVIQTLPENKTTLQNILSALKMPQ